MAPTPDDDSFAVDAAGIGGAAGERLPLLQIKADNNGVRTVTSLLKTINFCEKVNVFVSNAGIRFVVEEGKYVQAFAVFKAELFKTFQVRQDAFGFKIPFKELMDCLKILGGDSKNPNDASDITSNVVGSGSSRTMHISYSGYGTPFCLSLEEVGMLTEIELKTEEPDAMVDFDEVIKVWDITIDAKLLHDCLVEVESYNPDYVTLRVVPSTTLEFRANGSAGAGSMKISIPKNCSGIDSFCSIRNMHTATYKLSILKNSFKLIQTAEKVSLQMGEMDVLSFRLILKEGMEAVASFFIMPVTDTDDGDDEEGEVEGVPDK